MTGASAAFPTVSDVDFDHIGRTRHVHRGARREHHAVSGGHEAGVAGGAHGGRHRSSTSEHSRISSGCTPHSIARRWSTCRWCVRPTIGRRGRRRATAAAVRPENVGDEQRRCAKRLGEVARGVGHRLADGRLVGRLGQLVPVAEARLDGAARCDPCSAPPRPGTGPRPSRPTASRADVPSSTAFATSLASARVGSACSIIDSSICVAVITGFPRSSAAG